jgi:hypothetical protein
MRNHCFTNQKIKLYEPFALPPKFPLFASVFNLRKTAKSSKLRTAIVNLLRGYFKMHGSPPATIAEAKNNVDAIKLYQYLPRIDYKKCGEQGCFAFATKLSLGEKLPKSL